MRTVIIRKNEIHTNDISILVQNEVQPSTIQFIVPEASTIHDIENLQFKLLFYRSATDNGADELEKEYSNGILYLNWKPSKEFTQNRGSTQIQIFGINQTPYSTRWSTKPAKIYLYEDIPHTHGTELVPDFVSSYLSEEGV